jgi:hypothetical protein
MLPSSKPTTMTGTTSPTPTFQAHHPPFTTNLLFILSPSCEGFLEIEIKINASLSLSHLLIKIPFGNQYNLIRNKLVFTKQY